MFCFETWCVVERTDSKKESSRIFFKKKLSLQTFIPRTVFFSVSKKARKCKLWRFYGAKWPKNHFFESEFSNSFRSHKNNFISKTSALWKIGLKIWRVVKSLIERLTRCRSMFENLIHFKKVIEFDSSHKICFKICFSPNCSSRNQDFQDSAKKLTLTFQWCKTTQKYEFLKENLPADFDSLVTNLV